MQYSRLINVFGLLLLSTFIMQCKSSSRKFDNPEMQRLQSSKDAFFSSSFEENEHFKVFLSSGLYQSKKNEKYSSFSRVSDEDGDLAFASELKKYDKVNLNAEAVLRIEFFTESGKLKSVRFISPSPISEIDKIIADDITRWKFEFKTSGGAPPSMRIKYRVALQKRISREEAKKILKNYTN